MLQDEVFLARLVDKQVGAELVHFLAQFETGLLLVLVKSRLNIWVEM